MKTTWMAGICTSLLVASCGSTASNRMAMEQHAQQTSQSAQGFGRDTASTARGAGSTVVNATETAGNAVAYGARETGEAITGHSSGGAERSRERMHTDARQTAQAAEQTGRGARDATVEAGRTTYQAGATAVRGTEYGADVARDRVRGNENGNASSNAPRARGGGPSSGQIDLRCENLRGGEMRCWRLQP